jgi:acetyl/propionyl-CoA carboxylase alpha subunit
VLGVRTTIPFHRWLMRHPPFVAGDLDTEIVARDWQPSDDLEGEFVERAAVLAAISEHLGRGRRQPVAADAEQVGRWVSFARRAGLRVP